MKSKCLFAIIFTIGAGMLDAGRPDEDPYQPLGVGLRWESSVEISFPSGDLLHGTAVREIIRIETIAGKTYFVSETRYTGLPQTPPLIVYQRKTADGIFVIDESDPHKREYRETALPLVLGQFWTVGASNGRATFRVEAEQNVVAAGSTYRKCLKIVFHSDGGASHGAYYVAPGIGIVLDTAERDGIHYRLSLLSFRKVDEPGNAASR